MNPTIFGVIGPGLLHQVPTVPSFYSFKEFRFLKQRSTEG